MAEHPAKPGAYTLSLKVAVKAGYDGSKWHITKAYVSRWPRDPFVTDEEFDSYNMRAGDFIEVEREMDRLLLAGIAAKLLEETYG